MDGEALVMDPRCEVVLIANRKTGDLEDKTSEVASYRRRGDGRVDVVFSNRSVSYAYGPDRLKILHRRERLCLTRGQKIEVDGVIWESATEVCTFSGNDGDWSRVFYMRGRTEVHSRLRPAACVRILSSAAESPAAAQIMSYLRDVASRLPSDDSIRRVYESLDFVHPESALARYLVGATIEARERAEASIFPFRCNLSQREAVERALTMSVAVVEGPPGTGKTETILNLIANIIATGTQSVGVVSFSNTAVDNVREKLNDLGFGHVIARLGNRDRRREFFVDGQPERNVRVTEFVAEAPSPPPAAILLEVDRRLHRLQKAERDRAQLRQEADAYALELRHFEQHIDLSELPDLGRLPLLHRSSDRILDYLAETELEPRGRAGLVGRIRRYFRYGSLRGLDPADTGTVLRLQRAFYDRRITELTFRLEEADDELNRANFERLAEEHRVLSSQFLHAALGARYEDLPRTVYMAESYRQSRTFQAFGQDYPVLLSTCHSLRDSVPAGHLLDYLVIDEASQVDLLAAGAAMSCARNLVVVGDLKQLPHIASDASRDVAAPIAAYDCQRHSILSSLIERYPDELPRTLLREHYRCDPAIIGFCNKAFYDGELVPFTQSGPDLPMIVWSTVEGNHMRQHRGGGRSNQREVDVIVGEVIPQHCAGVPRTDIGITTPYRRQADKVTNAFVEEIEKIDADTVHKYQGRQKSIMIMTTVLDETWRGQTGLPFVDDPQMINVAVSRAVAKFILVTNHDLLSKSRYVRDLIDYIGYHALGNGVVRSDVVSMFDLLYREYSARLMPLAARLKNELRYRSEDIAWTVLNDVLAEKQYEHLTASPQVLLRNILVDVDRLTPRQATYVGNRASVDFVVYNRVSNRPVLAIEVDGFAYHENDPTQLERDALKDDIFRLYGMSLLRLPTTGSQEEPKIRAALDRAQALAIRSTSR